jgi:putative endonuclease
MWQENCAVGKLGEDIAARFLARKGYVIIGRNIKTFVGEIDIVAKKGVSIIFVEVKTRKTETLGPPYLSVTNKKKRKLIQCALCYLKMKYTENVPWSIDVISVELDESGGNAKQIEHFEDAIEE